MQHGQEQADTFFSMSIHANIISITILMERMHATAQRKCSYLKIFQFKTEKSMFKTRYLFYLDLIARLTHAYYILIMCPSCTVTSPKTEQKLNQYFLFESLQPIKLTGKTLSSSADIKIVCT
jgi:hypothetical protein